MLKVSCKQFIIDGEPLVLKKTIDNEEFIIDFSDDSSISVASPVPNTPVLFSDILKDPPSNLKEKGVW